MRLDRPKPLCEVAEKYYYDFLCEGSDVAIPREILRHMDTCKECKRRIEGLRANISALGSVAGGLAGVDLTKADVLRLHFAFLDEPVCCSDVRPFLPTLLDPATEVGVPTPVTAHIEKCESCRNDLRTIRELDLKPEQLQRLSQVFSESQEEDLPGCSEAQTDLLFAVLMTFRETDSRVLKHICCCRDCRRLLYEHRESLLAELRENGTQGEFPCTKVSVADIFDYVVPYGLDPSGDQYARFRESLTSHVRDCPTCLGKMQRLHEEIYSIVERDESEIVTVFHMCDSEASEGKTKSDDVYSGFPVTVDVFDRRQGSYRNRQESLPAAGESGGRLRRKSGMRVLQAAALIIVAALVGAGLLFRGQPVQATYLDSIYSALEPVRNIYIAKHVEYGDEPVQEQWVSRDHRLYLNKMGERYVLCDFGESQKEIKDAVLEGARTEPMSSRDQEGEDSVYHFLNLIPSIKQLQINENTPGRRIVDEDIYVDSKTTKVYVLEVVRQSTSPFPAHSQWRFFIDRLTNFPTKVELWKRSQEAEYRLSNVYELSYPDTEDILGEISEARR